VRGALRDDVVVGVTVLWWALAIWCVVGLVLALYRIYAAAEAAHNRARVIYHPQGVVPQVVGMNVSPPVALGREREMLALGMGADNTTFRIGSPAIREILKQAGARRDDDGEVVDIAPDEIIRPDPQNNPDVLVVGKKGSGKTNVLRYLISVYRNTLPGAEFLILSPLLSNWPDLETVSQPMDVFNAVMAFAR